MFGRFMNHFSDWFSSVGGVVETFLGTMAIVGLEHVRPTLDPNGFLLLYWLTVYSGVTQPVLAYAARIASQKLDLVLARLDNLLMQVLANQEQMQTLQESSNQMLRNQMDMMRAIIAIAERIEHGVEEIAEDIEDMAERGELDAQKAPATN